MKVPSQLLYTREHEWISISGNEATVGITDFAQGELGDIVFVEIETEGETLKKGEIFGSIEAVKTVSELYMPLTGTVVQINPELEKSPELVNSDPYGEGWMIKITFEGDLDKSDLLDAAAYQELAG